MDHTNRGIRWRRIRAASRPQTEHDRSSEPRLRALREPLLQIQVTFRLPRELSWLLAGIAIGHLLLPYGMLEKAIFFL